MVFEIRPKRDIYKVEPTPGIDHVFYSEIFGSPRGQSIQNPITAAYLRIENGPPVSPPVYTFDEAGIVIEGEVDFEDETGQKRRLVQGDTFLIRRGGTMIVSSRTHGLIFKAEGMFMGEDIDVKVLSSKI